jgi:hypothetical protein
MPFAAADCPACKQRIRLVWKFGGKKIKTPKIILVWCPRCRHRFEQPRMNLIEFSTGKEGFSAIATVEVSDLKY